MNQPVPDLEFSAKYDDQHADAYRRKHERGFFRRLSNSRDMMLAKKALAVAGKPASILDLPCGAGRFWPVLSRLSVPLIAADTSRDMLKLARQYRKGVDANLVNTSAFAIGLASGSVDSIFCMRLIHHIGLSADRLAILQEFHRVCRRSVCISLWVDGNLQAYRRRRLEQRRNANSNKRPYQNRFVVPAAQFESECLRSGFSISGKFDMLPGVSMWRVYTLSKIS